MRADPGHPYAVITGDLVKSSKTDPDERGRVLKKLRSVFDSVSNDLGSRQRFQIFRGDSFQTVLVKPMNAIRTALLLRCRCLLDVGLDVRLAVGIGPIEYRSRKSIGEGAGPAYTLSGHALDGMSAERLVVATPSETVNAEMVAFTALLDAVVRSWTKRSIVVAALSLAGNNQNAIAVTLGISQSAVSQRLAVAQWWAVAAALERWDDLCKDTFTKT